MNTTTAISHGQIWREVNPRRGNRHVRVETIAAAHVGIRKVEKTTDGWAPAAKSRVTYAQPARFNGKHNGYQLIQP